MQRIAVVGAGYAGLCTALAFANRGYKVTCVDSNPERVRLIAQGNPPFYERGLKNELKRVRKKGLLTAARDAAIAVGEAQSTFICVGTPAAPDGALDLSQIRTACAAIGEGLRPRPRPLVVVKSTVLPGTTESVIVPLLEEKSGLDPSEYRVCFCPEFLQEGRALEDSLHPSHIIIGERDTASGNALQLLLKSFHAQTMRTSIRTAEAIKYATNAFLATKVTFANEIANLCTRLNLDADEVLRGMSLDPRVNPRYLVPGAGFGGSCLSKDVRAVVRFAESLGYTPSLLSTLLQLNDRQPLEIVDLLERELGSLRDKRVALLGLAFKPGTDDVRESRALPIARELARRGATVVGYDPVAGPGFARLGAPAQVVDSVAIALDHADGCIIQAAWPEFRRLAPTEFEHMNTPVVVDGRRTWPQSRIPKGIRYRRVG